MIPETVSNYPGTYEYPCIDPLRSRQPITERWPTMDEHRQFMEWASCTLKALAWKVAVNKRYGKKTHRGVYTAMKKAYLWLTALNSFDPDLFEGNYLPLNDYWSVVARVREMYSGDPTTANTEWTSW